MVTLISEQISAQTENSVGFLMYEKEENNLVRKEYFLIHILSFL